MLLLCYFPRVKHDSSFVIVSNYKSLPDLTLGVLYVPTLEHTNERNIRYTSPFGKNITVELHPLPLLDSARILPPVLERESESSARHLPRSSTFDKQCCRFYWSLQVLQWASHRFQQEHSFLYKHVQTFHLADNQPVSVVVHGQQEVVVANKVFPPFLPPCLPASFPPPHEKSYFSPGRTVAWWTTCTRGAFFP